MAPKTERKDRITTKDIETYFKIAEFPLTKTQFTLPNAKAAGYLDAVGNGEYKLNAVGHNLVVHSMPRRRRRQDHFTKETSEESAVREEAVMIGQLITDVEALGASFVRGHAVNVNDQSSKDRAIGLATRYFNDSKTKLGRN